MRSNMFLARNISISYLALIGCFGSNRITHLYSPNAVDEEVQEPIHLFVVSVIFVWFFSKHVFCPVRWKSIYIPGRASVKEFVDFWKHEMSRICENRHGSCSKDSCCVGHMSPVNDGSCCLNRLAKQQANLLPFGVFRRLE